MPKPFDASEWFVIISICVMLIVLFMLPRRFPTIVTILFLSHGMIMPFYFDFFLAPPPIDLYDSMDTNTYDLFDLPLYILYAPFAYLFVYFFDKLNLRGLYITLYVLAWSVLGSGYEALAEHYHVYRYKNWNLGYSFLFYMFIQTLLIAIYYFVKLKYNKSKQENAPEWK